MFAQPWHSARQKPVKALLAHLTSQGDIKLSYLYRQVPTMVKRFAWRDRANNWGMEAQEGH